MQAETATSNVRLLWTLRNKAPSVVRPRSTDPPATMREDLQQSMVLQQNIEYWSILLDGTMPPVKRPDAVQVARTLSSRWADTMAKHELELE